MTVSNIRFPEPLRSALRDGELVVFAGAGVSMGSPACLPDFTTLADSIAKGSGETRWDSPRFVRGVFDGLPSRRPRLGARTGRASCGMALFLSLVTGYEGRAVPRHLAGDQKEADANGSASRPRGSRRPARASGRPRRVPRRSRRRSPSLRRRRRGAPRSQCPGSAPNRRRAGRAATLRGRTAAASPRPRPRPGCRRPQTPRRRQSARPSSAPASGSSIPGSERRP